MSKRVKIPLPMIGVLLVAGCAVMEPRLPTADPQIPAAWPLPPTTAEARSTPAAEEAAAPATAVAEIGWRDFFTDPRLEELVALALDTNRDLRVAALNVQRTRAQYRIERADRLPSVAATGTLTRTGGSGRSEFSPREYYEASIGIADFEIDLFGRVRNLSQAALQRYFAEEEARRTVQLSLVAEIASAYLTLSADRELQRVAQEALANREDALELIVKRHQAGAVSSLDVAQAEAEVELARADMSRYAGFVAQDINALTLLVGAPIDAHLLPGAFDMEASGLSALPPGLPSEVLLRRPDVLRAEHQLRAANANIGAARAAFFPSISLTGSIGTASEDFSGLFGDGSGLWSFIPRVNLPIFQGGRLRANLDVAEVDREISLAQYEQAIQIGFREVADALALTRTLAEQKAAQEARVNAAARAHESSRARYEAGRDSYLILLDAQRTLYAAQQQLVQTQLAEQINRVTLYRVLGGGWEEQTQ